MTVTWSSNNVQDYSSVKASMKLFESFLVRWQTASPDWLLSVSDPECVWVNKIWLPAVSCFLSVLIRQTVWGEDEENRPLLFFHGSITQSESNRTWSRSLLNTLPVSCFSSTHKNTQSFSKNFQDWTHKPPWKNSKLFLSTQIRSVSSQRKPDCIQTTLWLFQLKQRSFLKFDAGL